MYIDKLDDIVNKYNNTYHSTISTSLLMENQAHVLTLVKKIMMKILNLKLVILLEYQNIKQFYKTLFPNWSEEDFEIKKVKSTVSWTYVNIDC